ncbi:hypothetical protein [uncultured Sphingomonas sp.]|uniref:hypothetical protein n=1 Tax=uncultured Sphingomonas sp. TaxID=158754 RepID=UPI0025E0F05B|nr:hypothetical protein [uncultured Sphingomonas sp.]
MEPEKLPPPDPAPSLADQLGRAARRMPVSDGGALGWVLALMLPLGPILTTFGANQLAARVAAAPAETGASADDRAELHALARLGPAGFAPTLDRIARLLPPEARLVSVAVDRGEGEAALTAEIATADPDRLRAALSRDPSGPKLRAVGERRGDGVLIVSVEGEP